MPIGESSAVCRDDVDADEREDAEVKPGFVVYEGNWRQMVSTYFLRKAV